MIEQELASIIKFVLDATDDPAPYYHNIPEDFFVPAVYFPTPEITTGGETFLTYRMEYDWCIHFIHSTTEDAHVMALKAITAIKESRNLIPLIDMDGKKTGDGIRINDPSLRVADMGVVKLMIRFVSRRPYAKAEGNTAKEFTINGWRLPNIYQTRTIDTTLASAIEHYLGDYPHPEKTGEHP